jgi:1-acyl-sn-glycerol-3-phosphate acyltransferase
MIANHTSMADIMLMLAIIKKPFVGSKNLLKFRCLGFLQKNLYFSDQKFKKKPNGSFLTGLKR